MTTVLSAGSRWLLARAALSHAIALALGGEHGRVMCQAIEQCRRQLLVTGKDGDPFGVIERYK
jgi:hypothetical protein